MMVKVANLKLGVNVNHCLGDMRTKAYQLKKREEAEENRKPKWYIACDLTLYTFAVCTYICVLHCTYLYAVVE